MFKAVNVSRDIQHRKILDDINLSFSQGFICIVGDSGAGKSTLLNILGGLDIPTSGAVLISDSENGNKSISEIENYQQSCLGFVFQDANLINGLTVYENIELSMQITKGETKETDIKDVLAQFGLSHVAETKVENVSGGERLRAAIARTVIRDVPIILADEPTGSLDHNNSVKVFELLKNVSQDRIVIAVTHNLSMAKEYADRIITISDGKIVGDELLATNGSSNESQTVKPRYSPNSALPTKLVKKLTLNNIKRFKSKFLLSVFAMGIALAALGIIYTMNGNVHDKTKEMNTVYYDADIVTFYPYDLGEKNPTSIVMGTSCGSISNEMLNEVSCSDLFSEVIPVCSSPYRIAGTEQEIKCKLITLDSFFEERLMTDNVFGKFPESDKQVIISQELADAYFDGDAIGKTMNMSTDYGYDLTYEIVGVNAEKNVDGICYTYIPNDSVKNATYTDLLAYLYLASVVEDDANMIFTENASGMISELSSEKIIYGSKPTGANQIVISCSMAKDIYGSMTEEYIDIDQSNILNADDQLKKCLDTILREKYYIGANDAYKCNVVGIHNGASDKVLVTDDWKDVITAAIPNYIECYCKDMQTVSNFKNEDLASKYSYVSNYEERFENAVSVTDMWGIISVVVLAVVSTLCIVMIHAYSKSAITGRMYEIGILGSLGLRNGYIKKMLRAEIYVLGAGAWCCGGIIFLIYAAIFRFILNTQFGIFEVAGVLALQLVGTAIIILLTSNYETKKAVKTTIIDAIRKRE